MRVRYQIGEAPIAAPDASRIGPAACRTAARDGAPTAPTARLGGREVPVPRRAVAAPAQRVERRKTIPHPALAAALLLAVAGCASFEPVRSAAWRIDPVQRIKHSAVAADGHYALGRYHDGMRAWDKAVDAYWQAIAADPRHVEAYNALGVALAQLGRHDEAELALRRAMAIEPRRAHPRSNLGLVLLQAGRTREAVAELKLAVKLDPVNPTALANLRTAVARWQTVEADAPADAAAGFGPLAALPAVATRVADPAAEASDQAAAAQGSAQQRKTDGLAATAVVAEGSQTISVAAPVTTVELAAPLGGSVDVPAPPLAQAPPATPDARVVDRPTVTAWPRAVVLAAAPRSPQRPRPTPRRTCHRARRPWTRRAGLRLELSNGNGVPGMAARLGRWMARQGVSASRVTNQRPFVQEQTVVEYRQGQEGAAWRVIQALPLATRVGPALRHGLQADVRVVLGRDWRNSAACMQRDTCPPVTMVVATRMP